MSETTPEDRAHKRMEEATEHLISARWAVERAISTVSDGHYDERAEKAEKILRSIQKLVRDADNLSQEYFEGF